MMRSWEQNSPCFYHTSQVLLEPWIPLPPFLHFYPGPHNSYFQPQPRSHHCPSYQSSSGRIPRSSYLYYLYSHTISSIRAFNHSSFPFSQSFFMALLLLLPPLLLLLLHGGNAQPSPGYYPSRRFRPLTFYHGFNNLWGPQHQYVSGDQSSVTIWLDRNSGSGFKSNQPFRNGYFSTSIKLQRGYTAGVITAFYVRNLGALITWLSNNEAHPGFHDEVDIEFLGTMPGKPYTLQTNVYIRGSGDGRIIGREMKFHLWFDPTAGFHNYAILWSSREIM